MQRRHFLYSLALGLSSASLLHRQLFAHPVDQNLKISPLKKSDDEWQSLLSSAQYDILFEEGTEPPGSSPLNEIKDKGTFVCAACYLPLFESETKYDSGTGWPSFYQAIDGRIGTKLDLKLVWPRTEYHCARCGGHQGHVFEDGPEPTGLRYCNNGLALEFIPENKPLPALRT
ncbi:MAG: peptide-methionine (R)-S-oxide reductase MsrB [Gammaproteobacteria bacterium]